MPLANDEEGFIVRAPYPSGTLFRLRVTNRVPTHIYIFGSDDIGKVSRLFPLEGVSPWLDYSESTIVLPDDDHFIRMDQTVGEDRVFILVTGESLDFPDLLKAVDQSHPSLTPIETLRAYMDVKVIDKSDGTINDGNQLHLTTTSVAQGNFVVSLVIRHTK
ncbi:MAG: DUF4384 domain-containing protein [Bacteroidetes bacterium]|nr:DUF4384 domain-containing protein [Bacteroidota bacterium]